MLVLMRLDPDEREQTRDGLAEACFRKFRDAFYDHADDPEVYLVDQTDMEDPASAMSFTDGASGEDARKRILELVAGWNKNVESVFNASLDQLRAHAKTDENGSVLWLTGRSTDIYQLKKAAIALDGQAYDFADSLLLVNKHGYPTSLFDKDQLEHALAHPEDYVSFEVWPK